MTQKQAVKFEKLPNDDWAGAIKIKDSIVGPLNVSRGFAMVVEIRRHTDNVGDETKNQLLSQERAKVVKDYLVSKK